MKHIQPKQRGFTLIELLVVITIIGVLASLLLPVLARAKFKALSLKAQSNAGQIAKGIEAYRGDHEGRCAPQTNGGQLDGYPFTQIQQEPPILAEGSNFWSTILLSLVLGQTL